jgi:hypothetical protein
VDAILSALGMENMKRNAGDEANKAAIADLKKALGLAEEAKAEEIKAAVEELLKTIDEAAEGEAMVAANKLAGGEKLANGSENAAYAYAAKTLRVIKNRKEREAAVEALKNDSVMKALLAANASGKVTAPAANGRAW